MAKIRCTFLICNFDFLIYFFDLQMSFEKSLELYYDLLHKYYFYFLFVYISTISLISFIFLLIYLFFVFTDCVSYSNANYALIKKLKLNCRATNDLFFFFWSDKLYEIVITFRVTNRWIFGSRIQSLIILRRLKRYLSSAQSAFIKYQPILQARIQKFAMGGLFWGSGGKALRLEARKTPALENFAFFCKMNLILVLF